MPQVKLLIGILFMSTVSNFGFSKSRESRQTIDLNKGWKFEITDVADAFKSEFKSDNWQNVTIPHDWAFQDGISSDGAQADKGGYFGGGIGWYRKTLEIPADWNNKLVWVEFDGVYMNSEVWINGQYLGKRPYGYISFRYEISKYLKPRENLLAVRVDNSLEPSARWYHPCGIYAPVRLIATEKTFVMPNGIFITTPFVDKNQAKVRIEASIETQGTKTSKCSLETTILDASGKIIATQTQALKFSKTQYINTLLEIEIKAPSLWSPENPNLYKAVTKIIQQKKVLDEVETAFGIRTIKWEAETGFWLNGKQTKLLGVCEHWEGGPVGGAWTKPLLRWKLGLLKEMGVNAIRTTHNPCPPMFYDLCDEMGIMVMDEVFDGWSKKAPEDYGKQAFNDWWQRDVEEWITRNRNHPSIVIYSVGNETRGEIGKELVEYCHNIDSTRPVTSGHSASEFMDVHGVNGVSERMDFYIKPKLDKPFVATEAPHTWQTRGYYRTKTWFRDGNSKKASAFPLPDLTEKELFNYEWASSDQWKNSKQHFNSSYDNATVRLSARKAWEIMRDSNWYSGNFRWTGFDYYGEAAYVHGGWPFRLFMGGALDVAGFKKDLFYFYQSQWTNEPMVHILPHWTHPRMQPGTKIPVWVYSNCDEVELFLNGKSLGKDKPGTKWDEMQCEWMVPYEPGELIAKAYKNGKMVAENSQKTAKAPSMLKLTLNNKYINPEKDNVAIVTAATCDSNGNFYPYGENKLFYKLNGDASILSLENGDPVDTTKNYGVFERKAFMGLNNAIIQLNEKSQQSISLTVGAILGDKQLFTSTQVSIDVKNISIKGKTPEQTFEIFYNTDGSLPTTKSTKYTGAFNVQLGTTVNAMVFSKGEILLTMLEKFDKISGLYWSNPKEMEVAVLQGTKAIDANHKNCDIVALNKQPCLKFNDSPGYIRWYQENDGSAGKFTLRFYFEDQNTNSDCALELFVNGAKVNNFALKSDEEKVDNWKVVNVNCKLKAGANDIELRNSGKCNPDSYREGIYMMEIVND